MYKIRSAGVILALALLVCIGCGRSDLPDLGEVEGTVTLDNDPLPGAIVTFQPESGRPSYGETDEDGHYELTYLEDVPGAIVGKHTVSISTLKGGDEDAGTKSVPEKVPAKYNSDTELSADVASSNPPLDFDLSSEGEIKVQEE